MKTQLLFEISRAVAYALITGGLLIGTYKFKRLSGDQKVLLALLSTSFIVELLSFSHWLLKINNNYIYHVYSVVEFSLLGILYARNLNGLIRPFHIQILLVLFGLFALINALFLQSIKTFNSNVTFTEGLLLIVLALLYFYKLLRDMEHRNLERVPMFWINMSVLTYFSGALILFHVVNDLIPLPLKEQGAIWGTHALFNIVHYTLYSIALWVRPERSSS
jgi:hypothetical protein